MQYEIVIYRTSERTTDKVRDSERIYAQQVDSLDLRSIIKAINGLTEPEPQLTGKECAL